MSETHLKHIESEFIKLKEDLKNHKNGILKNCNKCSLKGNKLILTIHYSINDNLEIAKTKVEWDK